MNIVPEVRNQRFGADKQEIVTDVDGQVFYRPWKMRNLRKM